MTDMSDRERYHRHRMRELLHQLRYLGGRLDEAALTDLAEGRTPLDTHDTDAAEATWILEQLAAHRAAAPRTGEIGADWTWQGDEVGHLTLRRDDVPGGVLRCDVRPEPGDEDGEIFWVVRPARLEPDWATWERRSREGGPLPRDVICDVAPSLAEAVLEAEAIAAGWSVTYPAFAKAHA